jgi:hypothetical protein
MMAGQRDRALEPQIEARREISFLSGDGHGRRSLAKERRHEGFLGTPVCRGAEGIGDICSA